jgi:branched-chain amino acid transport system substrate-binding protein
MLKRRNLLFTLLSLLIVLMLALAACGGGETTETAPEATEAPVEQPAEEVVEEPTAVPVEEPTEEVAEEPAEEAAGVSCAEPVKVGLITDQTGALAIYGAHMLRSFPLGMEYATGSEGVEGDGYTSYMLDEL